MSVTETLLLTLHFVKLVNASLELGLFGSETSLSLLFDLVCGSRGSLCLLELSLLWLDNLHGVIILDNGLDPATDTKSCLTSILESCVGECWCCEHRRHLFDEILVHVVLIKVLHLLEYFTSEHLLLTVRPVLEDVRVISFLLLQLVLLLIKTFRNEEVTEGLSDNLETFRGHIDLGHLSDISCAESVDGSHSLVVDGHDLLEGLITVSFDSRGLVGFNLGSISFLVDFDDLFVDLDLLSFDLSLSDDSLLGLLLELWDEFNELLLDLLGLSSSLGHLIKTS